MAVSVTEFRLGGSLWPLSSLLEDSGLGFRPWAPQARGGGMGLGMFSPRASGQRFLVLIGGHQKSLSRQVRLPLAHAKSLQFKPRALSVC